MNNKTIISVAVIVLMVVIGSFCFYIYSNEIRDGKDLIVCTMDAKLCPDGSYVGRTGLNCEFSNCPDIVVKANEYINKDYGFSIIFPDSWENYSVKIELWKGLGEGSANLSDGTFSGMEYEGPLFIFKNPKTTPQQIYQDIPIMVFTYDVWQLVQEEKISLGAAPIGPNKIGENAKYVFATPARWYGFTDAIGWEDAIEIVKTFKTF